MFTVYLAIASTLFIKWLNSSVHSKISLGEHFFLSVQSNKPFQQFSNIFEQEISLGVRSWYFVVTQTNILTERQPRPLK